MEKMVLFDIELETLANDFLKKDGDFTNTQKRDFIRRQQLIAVNILENLLYYDKICFKVYGENVPLAILINIFGYDNIYKLIEQDAIEFMLWTPMVVYTVDNIKGVNPLASGNVTSDAHSIPEVSLKLGFHWLSNDPGIKTKKKLVKKLIDKYKIPPSDIVHNITNLSWSAYQLNEFKNLGIEVKDPMDLTESDKKLICNLATNVVESSIIAKFNYIMRNSPTNTQLIMNSFEHVKDKIQADKNIIELNRIENIPNIRELISTGSLSIDDILKLRNTSAAKEFRNWLNNQTYNKDTVNISQEYISAIVKPQGFFNTTKGKVGKTLFCYGLGVGISSLFAGPFAPIVGVPIAKALDIGANLGFSMFDTFLLSSLTSGWNPKLYMDNIKSTSTRKSV